MVGITKMKAEKQKAEKEAFFCTTKELSRLGMEQIPTQFQSHKHLIYSSPATLAFNSPGAEGFGVKRAGLAVPDSIMLIVAPGCCGRNTSLISSMKEYNDRFYYLMMDETDIVTGRHLKKMLKECLYTKVRKSGTEEDRRKFSFAYQFLIKFCSGTVLKFNLLFQL